MSSTVPTHQKKWRRFGDASSVSWESIMKRENKLGKWHKPQNRQAYLMRLWREDDQMPWRIMLQTINDGERENFPTIESFISHLEKIMQASE